MKVHSSPLYSGITIQYRAMDYCKRRAKKCNVNQNSRSEEDYFKHFPIKKYTRHLHADCGQMYIYWSKCTWPRGKILAPLKSAARVPPFLCKSRIENILLNRKLKQLGSICLGTHMLIFSRQYFVY